MDGGEKVRETPARRRGMDDRDATALPFLKNDVAQLEFVMGDLDKAVESWGCVFRSSCRIFSTKTLSGSMVLGRLMIMKIQSLLPLLQAGHRNGFKLGSI